MRKLESKDILAPEKAYPIYCKWESVRPPKEAIVDSLKSLESWTKSKDQIALPVVTKLTDDEAYVVIYCLRSIPVDAVRIECVKNLNASWVVVSEWGDGLAQGLAQKYWNKFLGDGYRNAKTMDEISSGIGNAAKLGIAVFSSILAIGVLSK